MLRILFIGLLLFSCKPKTIYVNRVIHDTLIRQIKVKPDTIIIEKNIIDTVIIDSLKLELFLNKYRIEKVRYYLNICLKNPSQDKFLKGWIKRALE